MKREDAQPIQKSASSSRLFLLSLVLEAVFPERRITGSLMAPASARPCAINHRIRTKMVLARQIRISARVRMIFQALVGAGASSREYDLFHR